jgi:hypothetical protein
MDYHCLTISGERDVQQRDLTVVAPVRTGRARELEALLLDIGGDVDDNGIIDFSKLERTHFARWVLLDRDTDRPLLVLGASYDGDVDDYLDHLAGVHGAPFDRIYGHCEDYPGSKDRRAFRRYMKRRHHPSPAFHVAYRGRPVTEVRRKLATYGAIQEFFDAAEAADPAFAALPPTEIVRRVRAHVVAAGHTLDAPAPRTALTRAARWLWLQALRVWIGPRLLVCRWRVMKKEPHDPSDSPDLPVNLDPWILETEDRWLQNELTHLADVKPGRWRRWTLALGLRYIGALARLRYDQGKLGGIPSIHFARWMHLEGGRLLFFSNYDGSWEAYLGDFIDQEAKGLTIVWSNTVGFPPTRGLWNLGATDEQAFKRWTRRRQLPTQVWWSATRDATVGNVRKAIDLCDRLAVDMNEQEARAWLESV